MQKFLVTLGISSALILAACSGSAPVGMQGASSSSDGSTIETAVGDDFGITLASNASTGFSWKVEFEKEVITLVNNEYVPPAVQMPGAGGKQIFIFRASKKGTQTLTFTYARPWEKDVPPAETRVITVHVQ